LTEQTKEGTVFRVDLRLRAEGMVGRLARSLEDYRTYYRTRGQVWERLALLKAWPVAGSIEVGKSFVRVVAPFVYATSGRKLDQSSVKNVIEDVRSVKEMIDAKMEERGHERRNVKLGVGGIREIEFLVQTVQVLAGGMRRSLLDRNTIGSLRRLASSKLVSPAECDALTKAYIFLRDVEHKLQMVHDLQTHALPEKDEELEECAIRMGYGSGDRREARRRFVADHQRHTAYVNNLFRSFFYRTETSFLFASTCRVMRLRRS